MDELQLRADEIYAADRAEDANLRLSGSLSSNERDEAMTIIEIASRRDPVAPVDDGPDDNWGGW